MNTDSTGTDYARFLTEEILPGIRQQVNLKTDPAAWAVCGVSSSGIAAFTLACGASGAVWQRHFPYRPALRISGEDLVIPRLIRSSREAPKPIRVWMQEGESDLDNMHGHWPLANQGHGPGPALGRV